MGVGQSRGCEWGEDGTMLADLFITNRPSSARIIMFSMVILIALALGFLVLAARNG
jgi:hypothetical protein